MRLEFGGKNNPNPKFFLNERIFFVVVDGKFQVAGKAASYPVAEVSRNYAKCTTRNLINEQKKKKNCRTPNETTLILSKILMYNVMFELYF